MKTKLIVIAVLVLASVSVVWGIFVDSNKPDYPDLGLEPGYTLNDANMPVPDPNYVPQCPVCGHSEGRHAKIKLDSDEVEAVWWYGSLYIKPCSIRKAECICLSCGRHYTIDANGVTITYEPVE